MSLDEKIERCKEDLEFWTRINRELPNSVIAKLYSKSMIRKKKNQLAKLYETKRREEENAI